MPSRRKPACNVHTACDDILLQLPATGRPPPRCHQRAHSGVGLERRHTGTLANPGLPALKVRRPRCVSTARRPPTSDVGHAWVYDGSLAVDTPFKSHFPVGHRVEKEFKAADTLDACK
ncbi:hypothetical protein NDU88_004279 [Pleurodeles waltl]|uniref:Uncharacterized protein n=1 Tax=Pleurodeles waltl TaxID=8319 RepID=A0AAV7QHC9_PLEWA|nr:hypothetical protein NDU88_004279 [Pleurodeles waltl]